MGTVAPRRPRIEFRADDPTLTPNGGLVLVAETCRVLDVVHTIDRHVGPIKARNRGSAGRVAGCRRSGNSLPGRSRISPVAGVGSST